LAGLAGLEIFCNSTSFWTFFTSSESPLKSPATNLSVVRRIVRSCLDMYSSKMVSALSIVLSHKAIQKNCQAHILSFLETYTDCFACTSLSILYLIALTVFDNSAIFQTVDSIQPRQIFIVVRNHNNGLSCHLIHYHIMQIGVRLHIEARGSLI
jgi:hypothetical protein